MKTLAEYRRDRNLSQVKLTQKLNEAGVKISSAGVAMYETGKRQPPLDKARAIAHFFGVSTDDIEFGPTGTDS